MKAPKNPRGGAAKMDGGHMAPPKGLGHYERMARGVHKLDAKIKGAPHSAGHAMVRDLDNDKY